MKTAKPASVDAYIDSFPPGTKKMLKQVRATIRKAAPKAEEAISYGLAGYKLEGRPLVYFGGFENHIGFYATPTGHKQFEKALSNYKQGKGSVQFPLDAPMPLALIERIVKFRVKENLSNAKAKSKTKKQ